MSSHRFVRREERQSRAEADPAKRYWPGRAPDWYKEDGEGAEDGDVPVAESAPAAFGKLAVKDEPGAAGIAAPTIVKKAGSQAAWVQRLWACQLTVAHLLQADPRLERLQAAQGEAEPSGRHIAPAQVVRRRHATPSDDEEEEAQPEPDAAEDEAAAPAEPASEEDEETVAHRAALRARCDFGQRRR